MRNISLINHPALSDTPFDLDYIMECNGVLHIMLTGKSTAKITLTSNGYLAYKKINESYASKILRDVASSAGLGGAIYVCRDSDLIRTIREHSDSSNRSRKLFHYIIMTIDDVIEIIDVDYLKIQDLGKF